MAKSCPVMLTYLPWSGLDARQVAAVEAGGDASRRALRRGQGSIEECFASVPEAKQRWRSLRSSRVAETMTIYSGSWGNPVAEWNAPPPKKRALAGTKRRSAAKKRRK